MQLKTFLACLLGSFFLMSGQLAIAADTSCNMSGGGSCKVSCSVGSASATCTSSSCTTSCSDSSGNFDPPTLIEGIVQATGGSSYEADDCVRQALNSGAGQTQCLVGGQPVTISIQR